MSNPSQKTDLIASRYITHILAEEKLGKIHSVFKNGFNVKVSNRLAFIGKGSHPLAAIGLNLENEALVDQLVKGLKAGTIIKFKQDSMAVYTRPTIQQIEFSKIEQKDLSLPKGLNLTRPEHATLLSSFEKLDAFGSSGFNDNGQLKKLYLDFHTNHIKVEDLVEQLIGLGIGLTPSGDDFIQGMLIMETVYGKDDKLQQVTTEKLQERSTTDVSIGYYRALLDGIATNEVWLQFLGLIPKNNEEEIYEQLRWMRRYGHTSGSDLLLGVETYLIKKQEELLS